MDSERFGRLIDQFAESAHPMLMRHVAALDEPEAGVPPAMQVGEVDEEGWVQWSVSPSAVDEESLRELERRFGVALPQVYREYLRARAHLFDQLIAESHGQQVLLPALPTSRPLDQVVELMEAWRPLLVAGYLPIAHWGDGWGPVCIDLEHALQGDGPVVWFDHEALLDRSPEEAQRRGAIESIAQALYPSCQAFLEDLFSQNRLRAEGEGASSG